LQGVVSVQAGKSIAVAARLFLLSAGSALTWTVLSASPALADAGILDGVPIESAASVVEVADVPQEVLPATIPDGSTVLQETPPVVPAPQPVADSVENAVNLVQQVPASVPETVTPVPVVEPALNVIEPVTHIAESPVSTLVAAVPVIVADVPGDTLPVVASPIEVPVVADPVPALAPAPAPEPVLEVVPDSVPATASVAGSTVEQLPVEPPRVEDSEADMTPSALAVDSSTVPPGSLDDLQPASPSFIVVQASASAADHFTDTGQSPPSGGLNALDPVVIMTGAGHNHVAGPADFPGAWTESFTELDFDRSGTPIGLPIGPTHDPGSTPD
jgi:hypothetical protein